MSNLFSRRSYEPFESKESEFANEKYASIVLEKTVNENTSACYSNLNNLNGVSQIARPMKNTNTLDMGTKTEIESLLRNSNLELNSPKRTNTSYADVKLVAPSDCDGGNFTNVDSRFTNPQANYREMYTCDYNFNPYLPINMQQVLVDNKVFIGSDRDGTSSRYDSKVKSYGNCKVKSFEDCKVNTYGDYFLKSLENTTNKLYEQQVDNIDILPSIPRKYFDTSKYKKELLNGGSGPSDWQNIPFKKDRNIVGDDRLGV